MPAVTTSGWASTVSSSQGSTQQKKFNTLSALSNKSSNTGNSATVSSNGNNASLAGRGSVKGLFESAKGTNSSSGIDGKADVSSGAGPLLSSSSSRRNLLGVGPAAAAAVAREDGPWSVSVAEVPLTEKRDLLAKKSRKTKVTGPQLYTLYVTTPTHNLTLTRSSNDLVELDARLREGQLSSVLNSFPTLPSLPQPSVSGAALSRSKLLQTISRTLSPSGNKNRAGLSQLSAAGGSGTDYSASDPSNSNLAASSIAATSSSSKSTPTSSTPGASAPISPANEEPSSAVKHSTTTQLATYLTSVANLSFVKRHKAWKRFVRVGSDDLQSVRVERRIRKIRSDLAKHVKSPVAPANTNVAATPSQSDIGEEGGRTDDDRSFSGRSTSHSFRNDRQDASARSASTDGERSGRDEARKNPNFAGIPEESERQASSSDAGDVNGLAPSSSKNALASSSRNGSDKQQKRERRHRKRTDEKVTVDDFDMIRVLGKGCAGKVLLVRHKPTKGLFAMKSIHKRHVLAHQELQHTLTEQAVLKRMAKEVMDPFVVKLWWSFHDSSNLYLVMDFHPGGDLATQLSRWGRLGRDRARFYAAEIVEGVEGLHRAGVIYRDLKPENVLIGVDGHIVLSDFGLSKEFPVRSAGDIGGGSSTPPPSSHAGKDGSSHGKGGHWLSASEDAQSNSSPNSSSDAFPTSGRSRSRWTDDRDVTTTFCGTAEYLAPEVIQGAAYSYEVDWWSFGTMLYEMLTGITPFWADTHADMYVRVLHDDLVFPDDRVLDQDTKSILRGLLQRNPMLRMKEPRIKKHPYFSMIEWDHVFHKRYIPPYIPPINPLDETDTQNFDETFLDMKPVVNGADDGEGGEDEENDERAKSGSGLAADETKDSVASEMGSNVRRRGSDGKSLFDGYSFRGRRDSGSVRSSIFSSDPGENAEVTNGVLSARPRVESDDDDEAARAAVAALDHLEREAAASEAAMSSPSQRSTSTHPTSIKGSDDANRVAPSAAETHTKPPRGGTASKAGVLTSNVGQPPATIAESEREDEDEDWDMVDAPSANEPYMSEANGGKGQNLFARGVVDTYRLLRRQESSRLPLGASYSGRTLNRLSRRQHSSPRDSAKNANRSKTTGGGAAVNGSAISLGSRSGNEGGSGTPLGIGEDESNTSFGQTLHSSTSIPGAATSSPALTPSDEANRQRKAASPSLASSDDQALQDKANKQRMKKMKRFTNFFETSR